MTRRGIPWVVAAVVVASVGVAVFVYRRALERPESIEPQGVSQAAPGLGVRRVRIVHPVPGKGLVSGEFSVPGWGLGPQEVGSHVVRLWASLVADALELAQPPRVIHFFLDDNHVAYVDLDASFLQALRVGTQAELELLASLRESLALNLPSLSDVVLMGSGQPLRTAMGHVALTPLSWYLGGQGTEP